MALKHRLAELIVGRAHRRGGQAAQESRGHTSRRSCRTEGVPGRRARGQTLALSMPRAGDRPCLTALDAASSLVKSQERSAGGSSIRGRSRSRASGSRIRKFGSSPAMHLLRAWTSASYLRLRVLG